MSSIGENNVLDYSDIYHFMSTTEILVLPRPVILRQALAKEPLSAYWACSAEAAKAAFFCDLHGRRFDGYKIWHVLFKRVGDEYDLWYMGPEYLSVSDLR